MDGELAEMKTVKHPICGGCGDKFSTSTAQDETKFCSELCEKGKYPYPNKHKVKKVGRRPQERD